MEVLVDYVRGLGASADRVRVADHLSRCHTCAVLATQLSELAVVARDDTQHNVPDAAFDAALAIFSAGAAARFRGCEVARQVFDSRHSHNGHRDDEPRRMLFQTSGVGLDLTVSHVAERIVLRGEIVDRASGAPLAADVRAEREWDGVPLTRARGDGMFTLTYPAPLAALLRIVVDGALHPIALPLDVQLPHDPA